MKLKLAGVTKTFATKNRSLSVLEDINLEVDQGEFVCLVGPSGCGKSTLLNLIAGLEKPDRGEIFANGSMVRNAGTDRVLIFQEPALFPWLNVIKNVEFGLKMIGVPREKRSEVAFQFLKMVHLSRFHSAYVHELSGGMKQRVALARALALNPEVLLMDEPFASLDAQTRDLLHEELQEIWSTTGKTILFVTHNVREAVCLGDRVLVLSCRPGRIKKEFSIELGRPRDANSLDVVRLAAQITEELKVEVEKVVREELDGDWAAASKGGVLPSSVRSLGDGI